MPAMVCVVQNGSSVRTSACMTARITFSCASAVDIPAVPAAASSAMAKQDRRRNARVNCMEPSSRPRRSQPHG
jgi:hypothetical protein